MLSGSIYTGICFCMGMKAEIINSVTGTVKVDNFGNKVLLL